MGSQGDLPLARHPHREVVRWSHYSVETGATYRILSPSLFDDHRPGETTEEYGTWLLNARAAGLAPAHHALFKMVLE